MRRVTRLAIVGVLLRKELIAYSRDLVYVGLTIALLIVLPLLFRLMPDSVDESITLAVAPPLPTMVREARSELLAGGASPEQLARLDELDVAPEEGLDLLGVDSAAQVAGLVEGTLEAWRTAEGAIVVRDPATEPEPAGAERADADIGIAFPAGFIADVVAGEPGIAVTVYADAAVPPEVRAAMGSFVRELANAIPEAAIVAMQEPRPRLHFTARPSGAPERTPPPEPRRAVGRRCAPRCAAPSDPPGTPG
jgi:hypothetical protein